MTKYSYVDDGDRRVPLDALCAALASLEPEINVLKDVDKSRRDAAIKLANLILSNYNPKTYVACIDETEELVDMLRLFPNVYLPTAAGPRMVTNSIRFESEAEQEAFFEGKRSDP